MVFTRAQGREHRVRFYQKYLGGDTAGSIKTKIDVYMRDPSAPRPSEAPVGGQGGGFVRCFAAKKQAEDERASAPSWRLRVTISDDQ